MIEIEVVFRCDFDDCKIVSTACYRHSWSFGYQMMPPKLPVNWTTVSIGGLTRTYCPSHEVIINEIKKNFERDLGWK